MWAYSSTPISLNGMVTVKIDEMVLLVSTAR